MIGSEVLASALCHVRRVFDDDGWSQPNHGQTYVHEGQKWTFLGAGIDRRAYLGPDGVVYKHAWHTRANRLEHEFFRRHIKFSWAPVTEMYGGVLAMQYYPDVLDLLAGGDETGYSTRESSADPASRSPEDYYRIIRRLGVQQREDLREIRSHGIIDVHPGNLALDNNGTMKLIDASTERVCTMCSETVLSEEALRRLVIQKGVVAHA